MTLNIAHRGAANLWPENTLYAFAKSIDGGADGIELDLRLTRDGALAIHHDARLNPDATRENGDWLNAPTPHIADLTAQELTRYDIGRLRPDSIYARYRAGRAHKDNCHIALFDAACALIAAKAPPDFRLYVELKTDMAADPSESHAIIDALLIALADNPLADAITLVSFDWRCLRYALAQRPAIRCAFTTRPYMAENIAHYITKTWDKSLPIPPTTRDALEAMRSDGACGWFAHYADATDDNLRYAEELGLRVSVWTVNDADIMARFKAHQIEAIITDRPDLFPNDLFPNDLFPKE